MVLPFGLIGFLAKVSKILADEKIPIFVISAYSTDHILVKEKDLARAEEKLKSLDVLLKRNNIRVKKNFNKIRIKAYR